MAAGLVKCNYRYYVDSNGVVATLQSTLADISNSLQLGLIDNAVIANALSSKIQAAQSSVNAGQDQTAANILGAFENQVNAQNT